MEERPYSSRLKKIRELLEQTSVTREEVVSELGGFLPPIAFRLHVTAWSQACPSVLRWHSYALQDPCRWDYHFLSSPSAWGLPWAPM